MNMDLHNTLLEMISVTPDAEPELREDLEHIFVMNIIGVSVGDCEKMLAPVNKRWASLMSDIYGSGDGYNPDFESEYR